MTACTILTITGDEQLLRLLQEGLHDQNGGGTRIIVAATMDEASSLLTMAQPRLIVVHWKRRHSHYEELNRLLWTTTTLARLVPVLIIADRYLTDQATRLYRMGVTEYISLTKHRDRFGKILESYLHPAPSARKAVDVPVEPAKGWSPGPKSAQAQVI
jgi:DNA-binding NtrC family response regulator